VTVVTDASTSQPDGSAPTAVVVSRAGGTLPRASRGAADEVAFPTREQYRDLVAAYRDGGFETCADLCATG
jgi:hypothetical protein